MQIYTLEYEEDYSFDLIGISSHEHDYRLAWALNRHMGWNLECKADLVIQRGSSVSRHALFSYEHLLECWEITLLGNKSTAGTLLPEMQQFDYFLKIENVQEGLGDEFIRKIRSTEFVQTVMQVDVNKCKTRHHLIF